MNVQGYDRRTHHHRCWYHHHRLLGGLSDRLVTLEQRNTVGTPIPYHLRGHTIGENKVRSVTIMKVGIVTTSHGCVYPSSGSRDMITHGRIGREDGESQLIKIRVD